MTDPIIRATGIEKTFRNGKIEVHALRGIDFAVEPGEMVAVMGPSGCGKTTMLNCLSGLDECDQGDVWIEGQNLQRHGRSRPHHLPSPAHGLHLSDIQLAAGDHRR